jgi:xanthine dehydrogenase YagS FAD-binding subunit
VVLKAGGVDLVDLLKEHLITPKRVVNLRTIQGLDHIEHDERSGLKLGPLVTLHQLSEHQAVRQIFPALAAAAGEAATPQIRNMATLGGNLLQRLQCWYFRSAEFQCLRKGKEICFAFSGLNQYHAIMDYGGCPSVAPSSAAVALLALNGCVELTSAKGKRTVAIKDFYVQPDSNPENFNVMSAGELLTAIHIPKPAPGTRSAYQKYGEKESHDWAIADAAIVLEMDGNTCKRAVVAMGAASPVVRRSKEAEAMLTGKQITPDLAKAAGKASMTGALPLSMNAYKVQLFPVAVYRTILLAAGQMERDPSAAG